MKERKEGYLTMEKYRKAISGEIFYIQDKELKVASNMEEYERDQRKHEHLNQTYWVEFGTTRFGAPLKDTKRITKWIFLIKDMDKQIKELEKYFKLLEKVVK